MKTLKDYIGFPGLYAVRGNKKATNDRIGNLDHNGVVIVLNSRYAFCVTNLYDYEDYKTGCQVFNLGNYNAEPLENVIVTGEITIKTTKNYTSK
jgi:hypothetical protein